MARELTTDSFSIPDNSDCYAIAEIGQTGFLETPFPLLLELRAIALLSNYGFGFKTKLIDAIQARCYILVPKGLYNRLPEEIRPFCVVVKLWSSQSFELGLGQREKPYPQSARIPF